MFRRSLVSASRRRGVALVAVAAIAVTAAIALPDAGVSVAAACGGFFRARTVDPEKRPSLAREKVLLIHDADEGKQHFIREVAFQRATDRFGFVVPTPTRPQVAKIEKTPFTALRNSFAFAPPIPGRRGGTIGVTGSGFGGGSRGVEVLEVKKVGSFTAFVLAATDEKALAKWLAKNELVSTKEADAWLAHYVEMGFYYVAMRYDPPRKPGLNLDSTVEAETIRITFDTPIPYYPYLEPQAPEVPRVGPRLMELWYVGPEPVVPVALREHEGKRSWVRPLRAGEQYGTARERLEAAVDKEILAFVPAGEVVLQTFQDQKLDRTGFADVLFAPKQERELSPERIEQLRPLLAVLDPELVSKPASPEPRPEPKPEPNEVEK